MKITIEPTPEIYEAPVNGVNVPVRIWRGVTEDGVHLEAYVLAVTPNENEDLEKFRQGLPQFMVRASQMYQIADFEQEPPDVQPGGLH